MLIKTPELDNMVIVSMHTEEEEDEEGEEEERKKEDNNSRAPRISFSPPPKKP
jgi:hypothetical protein